MPVSSEKPTAYQHPRWFVRCVALGFALLYAGGLAVANIFPHGNQEHGWPLVYMVRASRVPGGLTVMYGAWPLDNPPIVQFRPSLLFLNCLCGILLTAPATIIPVYWLPVRQRPVQFNLRTLFVLTTVVACVLALLKCCYPDRVIVWIPVVLAIMFLVSLVYVVPACIVLTTAHWLVIRSARSGRRCRWLELHWLTWLAVCAVGGPFLHYSIVASKFATFGWPLEYEEFQRAGGCNWPPLVVDLAVWLGVLASTAFVVERWIRRVERRVTLQPRAIFFLLPLVVAVTAWVANTNSSWEPEWYDYYGWLFGIAGTLYAIVVLTVDHWKAVPKISLLAGTLAGAPLWFNLSPLLQVPRLVMGLSLVAAALAATAADAGYRVLMHRDQGVRRFVAPACGERIAVLPMWAVGVIGIAGGLVVLYT